jgi:uncharacterized membrane protein
MEGGETRGSEDIILTKARLEGLSDGIFAFSMTLLVISLNIPEKTALVQSTDFAIRLLLSLSSDFIHYIMAFLILGAFWLAHHVQFHSVRSIDRVFVWINLLTLMMVALLPFSTNFSGDFPHVPFAAIVFELNLFAIGIGMFSQWQYATHGFRLTEPTLQPVYIRRMRFRSLVIPFVSVLCILAALAGSTSSTAIFLTIPLFMYVANHPDRFRRDAAG